MRIRSLTSDTFSDTEPDDRPTGNGPYAYGKMTLVAGPPGSGKSTYVRKHMKRGDLVIDLDEIFKANASENTPKLSLDDINTHESNSAADVLFDEMPKGSDNSSGAC